MVITAGVSAQHRVFQGRILGNLILWVMCLDQSVVCRLCMWWVDWSMILPNPGCPPAWTQSCSASSCARISTVFIRLFRILRQSAASTHNVQPIQQLQRFLPTSTKEKLLPHVCTYALRARLYMEIMKGQRCINSFIC